MTRDTTYSKQYHNDGKMFDGKDSPIQVLLLTNLVTYDGELDDGEK